MKRKKHVQDDRYMKRLTYRQRKEQERLRNQISNEMLLSSGTLLYY